MLRVLVAVIVILISIITVVLSSNNASHLLVQLEWAPTSPFPVIYCSSPPLTGFRGSLIKFLFFMRGAPFPVIPSWLLKGWLSLYCEWGTPEVPGFGEREQLVRELVAVVTTWPTLVCSMGRIWDPLLLLGVSIKVGAVICQSSILEDSLSLSFLLLLFASEWCASFVKDLSLYDVTWTSQWPNEVGRKESMITAFEAIET